MTIGRSQNCSICFNNTNGGTSLSRIQCRIDYIDDKWILKDGDGQKPSTNGTWLFAGEEERIPTGDDRGVIFKAGSSLFKAISIMNFAGKIEEAF